MSEINPCPKCGSEDVYCGIYSMCRYDMYQVVCDNVPDDAEDLFCFEGPEYEEDEPRAIAEWNLIEPYPGGMC